MPIFIICLYGIIGVFYIELVMLLSGVFAYAWKRDLRAKSIYKGPLDICKAPETERSVSNKKDIPGEADDNR
jgi:hypothetical protein